MKKRLGHAVSAWVLVANPARRSAGPAGWSRAAVSSRCRAAVPIPAPAGTLRSRAMAPMWPAALLLALRSALLSVGLGALAGPLAAADATDPDWPCIQRRVDALSVGLMWPHPIGEAALAPGTRAEVDELGARLALRRLSLEDLAPDVSAFTAVHGADPALTGAVFAEVFERLSTIRHRVMVGITDYARHQGALATRIDAARTEVERLLAADAPDHDRIDALEEQIDWDERIYDDRADSLTYVCETPVLLEKRLYAVAQMLLAAGGE